MLRKKMPVFHRASTVDIVAIDALGVAVRQVILEKIQLIFKSKTTRDTGYISGIYIVIHR
jgi:hypothetical protein